MYFWNRRAKTASSASPSTSKRTSRWWIVSMTLLQVRGRQRHLGYPVMGDLQCFDGHGTLHGVEVWASPFHGQAGAEGPCQGGHSLRRQEHDGAVPPRAQGAGQSGEVPEP